MTKKYLDIDVDQAAENRLKYVFDHFGNVLVAFSGGKDSGLLLNKAYDYAKKHGFLDKFGFYFLDYEVQYQATIEYAQKEFNEKNDVKRFWLCLPNSVPTATSMSQGLWIPWEKSKRSIWVRQMPTAEYVINENNVPWNYEAGTRDYKVQTDFTKWFARKHGETAVLIGIRADESLDRYRAIKSKNKVNSYHDKNYITMISNQVYNAYPIYDWQVNDIWVANAKYAYSYNHIYDLYYKAGIPINKMRVASPFLSEGLDSLKYYQVIEPDTWAKMLGRVNGVNFAGIYGGTTAMGWKSLQLPKGMSWESYLKFLLNSLPKTTRENYENIFKTSLEFWQRKGGVLDDETINELKDAGIAIEVGEKTNYHTLKKPVRFETYPDDTPVKNFKAVPSYKRMCITIMKNDHTAKYMGFAQTKAQVEKRKKAIAKYKNLI
ncbi:phosphoadenosine phosphosulfate sulfotransferase [Lactobacillus selangorensis]|uniref:Phosphoadenosine phosphosulfate sulfotransferase n=1 Tax=Lactobacillus selangorensis TaxID=81857 RepID=A0A0R2FSD7_9LACO|nr:DUF3440 domain-containing protein [Lactobacillus selangorensis]KRN29247.1 phosphoadenosine phosphosulfate sulfotransferase [Lactobacillus selangorensis]KRN31395.1 phosphoadenosine phosphosulfate sulfotransferase [Lactobacillus selangorensis]